MGSAARKILEQALVLPKEEREKLLEALSDSLALDAVELSPEWTAEIHSRIAQLESGKVNPISWAEVDTRIKKTLDSE